MADQKHRGARTRKDPPRTKMPKADTREENDFFKPFVSTGAVAVIDALGFRAARKNHGVEKLVHSVKRIREMTQQEVAVNQAFRLESGTVAAFSDTIIISMMAQWAFGESPNRSISNAVQSAAASASQLVAGAAFAPAGLGYRGCIAVGPLVVDDGVFVGEAIDEAAEWYERAAAAIVWLTPSASAALGANPSRLLLLPWDLPLKEMGSLSVLAVNPFYATASLNAHADVATLMAALTQVEEKLLATFHGPTVVIDVEQKRQNTQRFLAAAKAHTVRELPSTVDRNGSEETRDG